MPNVKGRVADAACRFRSSISLLSSIHRFETDLVLEDYPVSTSMLTRGVRDEQITPGVAALLEDLYDSLFAIPEVRSAKSEDDDEIDDDDDDEEDDDDDDEWEEVGDDDEDEEEDDDEEWDDDDEDWEDDDDDDDDWDEDDEDEEEDDE